MKKKKQFFKQFELAFSGLKDGLHSFDYELTRPFFREYPVLDFAKDGKIDVEVELEKKPSMLHLEFYLEGEIECVCDRCGDDLTLPVQGHDRLIVKFDDEVYDETEEIIALPPSEHKLALHNYMYEFLYLSFPSKMVHKKGNCNEKAIEKLKQHSVKHKDEQGIDPRWEALKKLKQ